VSTLTLEHAIRMELELGLESGDIACDREMTLAEEIYLGIPRKLLLAIHLDLFGPYSSLILYEQEVGLGTKPYLKGAVHATPEDAAEDLKIQWAGLHMVREQGQVPFLEERVAATFTGWDAGGADDPGQRWSLSVAPKRIRNIFLAAPLEYLLLPKLEKLPPEYEGGRSPGMCIKKLGVQQVLWIHSIQFQGTTTLRNIDGHRLVQLAQEFAG